MTPSRPREGRGCCSPLVCDNRDRRATPATLLPAASRSSHSLGCWSVDNHGGERPNVARSMPSKMAKVTRRLIPTATIPRYRENSTTVRPRLQSLVKEEGPFLSQPDTQGQLNGNPDHAQQE